MGTLTMKEQANMTVNGAQSANEPGAALIPATPEEAVNFTLSENPTTRSPQIRALAEGPLEVREAVLLSTATAAEKLYGGDEEMTEFTRALESDPIFDDCLDDNAVGRPLALNTVL